MGSAMRWLPIVSWLLACCAFAAPALGQDRVALLIGNQNYPHATDLESPIADIRAVAARLSEIGFSVATLENATLSSMSQSLADFRERAQSAEVAIVYFAGHGRQFRRNNYLVPVDAEIRRPGDIHAFSLPVDDVIRQLATSGTERGLVILDAWRNDPEVGDRLEAEARRQGRQPALTESYSRIDGLPANIVLWMPVAPGEIAGGEPAGSPDAFASALLAALETPGAASAVVFRDLAARVRGATSDAQVPQSIGDFADDIVLVPWPAADPDNLPPVVPGTEAIVFHPIPLGLPQPTDPDGDPLTVTVRSVPDRGLVALPDSGSLSPGDRIEPTDLERLAYFPDLTGPASPDVGMLELAVSDGRGGETLWRIPLEQAPTPPPGAATDANRPRLTPEDLERRLLEPFLQIAEIFAGMVAATARTQIVVQQPAAPADSVADAETAEPDQGRLEGERPTLDPALARAEEVPPHDRQIALRELGHYGGAIDGLIGRGSRAGIRAFQRERGDPETGELTPEQIVALITAAAEAGDPDSQNMLAIMYGDGIGVAQDDAQALDWFRRSAEQDNAHAPYNLALHFRDGRGVPVDTDEAARLLAEARERGHPDAEGSLEDLPDDYTAWVPEDDEPAEPDEPPATPPVALIGNDSCSWANDGFCDDSGFYGNDTAACPHGTDASDCQGRTARPVSVMVGNSCQWAFDFECDEPGIGTGVCASGTDASDCGPVAAAAEPAATPAPVRQGNNTCRWAFDGECDDSRYIGYHTSACAHRTDEADCSRLQLRPASTLAGNTCRYAFNGQCDENRYVNYVSGSCPYGTDQADCAGLPLRR